MTPQSPAPVVYEITSEKLQTVEMEIGQGRRSTFKLHPLLRQLVLWEHLAADVREDLRALPLRADA
jgi:hypothetical protein